jgi:hypothetical protein
MCRACLMPTTLNVRTALSVLSSLLGLFFFQQQGGEKQVATAFIYRKHNLLTLPSTISTQAF